MTRSRLDQAQILKAAYDDSSQSLRVKLPSVTTEIELSHEDGDSVLSYQPTSNSQVSSTITAINTEVVPAFSAVGLQAVQLFGEVTVAATGVAVYKVQMSPSASGSDWYDVASATITMGTSLGATAVSAVCPLIAMRLRVVTTAAHALSAGTIKLTAMAR